MNYSSLTIDHVIAQDSLGEIADAADYDRYRALVVEGLARAFPGAQVSCALGLNGRTEIVDEADEPLLDGMDYDQVRNECREVARLAYIDFCR